MSIDRIIRLIELLVSVVIAVIVLVKHRKKPKEFVLFLFVCISFIISLFPLFKESIPYGHDIFGSLSRIESMAVNIKDRQFPSVILPTQANGFGCLGIIYAHLFFYIPAMVKYLGASTVCSYQFGNWFIQLMAGFIMYRSVKMIKDSDTAAFIATGIFLMMPYRLGDLYWREAFSESVAMSFLPLIIAAIYKMRNDNSKYTWMYLTIGMTGVFQSHMLTFIIAIALCISLTVIYFDKDVLIGEVRASIVFILLNIWFIVPFLYYYFSNINMGILAKDMSLKAEGFKDMLVCNDFSDTPNVIGVISFVIPFAAIFKIKDNVKLYTYLISTGTLGIWLASRYFPWCFLENRFEFVNIFQFPFRFLMITTVAFSILAGLAADKSNILPVLFAVLSLISGINEYNCLNGETFGFEQNNYDFDYRQEYLPLGVTSTDFYESVPIVPPCFKTTLYEKEYGKVTWCFVSADDRTDSCVDLPLIYYRGYSAKLFCNDDRSFRYLETGYGNHHWVRVFIPEGLKEGRVVVEYKNAWFMTVANIISLVTLIGMVIIYKSKR